MRRGTGRVALATSIGTAVSRSAGFVRNLALAATIGTTLLADTYNFANNAPNIVFLLLGGGAIAAVFVPQLTRIAARRPAALHTQESVLLLLGAVFGALATLLLLASTPLLLAAGGAQLWSDDRIRIAWGFALWCSPQLLFLAVSTVASQLLNARARFSTVGWAPIVNSVTVIAACAWLVVRPAAERDAGLVVLVLGAATLAGAILQSAVLLVALVRNGYRPAPVRTLRGHGLRRSVRLGGVTTVSTFVFQLGYLTSASICLQAGQAAQQDGFEGRGYTALFYAQTIILTVQAVLTAPLSNILLQRMSVHHAESNPDRALEELDRTLRVGLTTLMPAAAMLVGLGTPLCLLLFVRGATSPPQAAFIGLLLSVLAVGLPGLALHPLLTPAFYAVGDALRPTYSAATITAVWGIGMVAAALLLPAQLVLVGVASAFTLAYLIDLPVKLRRLRRRLGYRPTTVLKQVVARSGAGFATTVAVLLGGIWLIGLLPAAAPARSALIVALGCLAALGYLAVTWSSPASPVRLLTASRGR